MNERQGLKILRLLEEDESSRDRHQFDYTGDALRGSGILPLSIWSQPNQFVAKVISGEVKYDDLPIEVDNEIYKGMCWTEQQDIILRNHGSEALCEALNMRPCLGNSCVLYNPELGPPVCREYKIVFKKS